ncbi:MAG TPA: hypothetical protein V6D02_13555 [Candidatus Obscuribacterales bacterium]
MNLRLQTKYFRFVYTFASGFKLVGMVEGDCYTNAPNFIFNLRSLSAICLNPQGSLVMGFDEVFGQFTLQGAQVIFTGSQSGQGSFFSFNYRDGEATLYDATTDTWVATGWQSHQWQVTEVNAAIAQPLLPPLEPLVWSDKAIA